MSDLSPETRTLIETLRDADGPTAADRARNRGELASRLGIGVVAAGAVAAGAKTAAAGTAAASIGAAGGTKVGLGAGGLSLTMKLAGAAVVASGVAVSAVAVHESRQPEAVVAPHVVPQAAPRVVPHTVKAAPHIVKPRIVEELAAESDEAAPAPLEVITPAPRLPAPLASAPSNLAAPKVDLGGPPTSAKIEARNPAPSQERRIDAPSPEESARAEAPREERTATPATSVETTLAAETSLLVRAQEALVSGDSAAALALLDQHARMFPTGVLAVERDATRIAAMCASGQTERARTEAARFVATHPGSPMAARVRRTCEAR